MLHNVVQCEAFKVMAKTTQFAARVSEAEREELKRVAEVLDIPEAQIVREAVREKIDEMYRTHPKLGGSPAEAAA